MSADNGKDPTVRPDVAKMLRVGAHVADELERRVRRLEAIAAARAAAVEVEHRGNPA